MSYALLRSRYAHDLEELLDNGEITQEEAEQMMAEWEGEYENQAYDCWRDQQWEEQWAQEERG